MFKRLGRAIKPMVDFRPWLGTKQIAKDSKSIANAVKTLYHTDSPSQTKETFDEACKRQGMTAQALQEQFEAYFLYAIVFVLCAVAVLGYGIFLYAHSHAIHASLLCLAISVFFTVLAFRYHFWCYQLKNRKLGASLHDYFKNAFTSKKGQPHE